MVSLLHTLIAPGLLPHTVQLCIHCRENPAGFWVSRKSAKAVRLHGAYPAAMFWTEAATT